MKIAIAWTRITSTVPKELGPLSRVALHAPDYACENEEQATATAQTLVDSSSRMGATLRAAVESRGAPDQAERQRECGRYAQIGSHFF